MVREKTSRKVRGFGSGGCSSASRPDVLAGVAYEEGGDPEPEQGVPYAQVERLRSKTVDRGQVACRPGRYARHEVPGELVEALPPTPGSSARPDLSERRWVCTAP